MNGQIINGVTYITVPLPWLADVMHKAFGDARMIRLWGGAPMVERVEYVPFSQPDKSYADVRPMEDRDDYVGS